MKFIDWGTTNYTEAFARQKVLVEQRRQHSIEDTVVFTEHKPVFTVGSRAGSRDHLTWSEAQRSDRGVSIAETNRGGDITYHGPGQLVCYPILDWSEIRDLHAYLRFLEDVIINTIAHWDLQGSRREGKTGIWLENRKIAAIGVAVKQWVTYHGLAINVTPDLSHFEGIVPCGITDGSVTSIARELPKPPSISEVKSVLTLEFSNLFATVKG